MATGSRCLEYVPGPEITGHAVPRFGDASLTITVGPVGILLEGLGQDQRVRLTQRYGVFAAPQASGTAAPDVRVSVFDARREGFLVVGTTGQFPEMYRIVTSWKGSLLMATSYEWSGWVDLATGDAGLALGEVAQVDQKAFHRSVENFLRVIFAHLVVRKNGFLLHSAGLVRDGKAYIFFGPSGSGKTTVTALTPEASILSDDLTLVTLGEDGAPRACSVPFRGVFAPEYSVIQSFPVAGFFRLVQSPDDSCEKLTGARAVGELVGSLPFVFEARGDQSPILDAVEKAAIGAPVCRLKFTKSRSFWNTLSGAGLGRPVDSFSDVRGMKA